MVGGGEDSLKSIDFLGPSFKELLPDCTGFADRIASLCLLG